MLKRLNNEIIRLWKDEEGVVLAFSVIMFMTLFMMAFSVYAVGETVRKRIELQNAADAAAYSAAVVQSDIIGSVAALNRAMSWTYVQLGRMEMDYIVDKWLEGVIREWDRNNRYVDNYRRGSCRNRKNDTYYTGYPHEKINVNGRYVSVGSLRNFRNNNRRIGKSYSLLIRPINDAKQTISSINAAQRNLIGDLPDRIDDCVNSVLKSNIRFDGNDTLAGGAKISYTVIQERNPLRNLFEVWRATENNENNFLRFSDYIPEEGNSVNQVLGTGAGTWYNLVAGGTGFSRRYVQRDHVLRATWNWYTSYWRWRRYGSYGNYYYRCRLSRSRRGSTTVRGRDFYDAQYEMGKAEPQVLREEFFTERGSIIVGVSRKANNPFEFMAINGQHGITKPFSLDNGNRYMWTASAAIAGYNPIPLQSSRGEYEVTYENNSGNNLWNLKTSDWDAVLLPLHRARSKGRNRSWQGESGGSVLAEVKNSPWKSLYGGGSGVGSQRAPRLMGNGDFSYNSAERLILH